jgi:type I restriction enzyme M protein
VRVRVADARWDALLAKASQPDIGVMLDRALDEIERQNEPLRNVLPKVYAKAARMRPLRRRRRKS